MRVLCQSVFPSQELTRVLERKRGVKGAVLESTAQ